MLDRAPARPEPRAALLVGVRLACHPVANVRYPTRVGGRPAPRKAGDGKVHASPEKVDRAGFADEPPAELFEYPLGPDQDPPEAGGVFRVVGCMLPVLVEWNRPLHLDRLWPDSHLDPEFAQSGAIFAVEVRHRAGNQSQGTRPIIARME